MGDGEHQRLEAEGKEKNIQHSTSNIESENRSCAGPEAGAPINFGFRTEGRRTRTRLRYATARQARGI
jgi:hypothetical protein